MPPRAIAPARWASTQNRIRETVSEIKIGFYGHVPEVDEA
jgi:hypothetical protein